MKRLFSTVHCDVRLQWRNGFYYAAAAVAIFWIAGLHAFYIPSLAWLLPVFLLSNLLINTFYFIGGLVLLEKGEGTLSAQMVSPLRHYEYITSKLATLTFLSVLENFTIVISATGFHFRPVQLIGGIVLASVLFTLTGLIVVSKYDSINEYLFPSFLYTIAFVPPVIDYLGLFKSSLFYIHPLYGPLLLLKAAFQQVQVWQYFYGILYPVPWIVILLFVSRRKLEAFIVRAEYTE